MPSYDVKEVPVNVFLPILKFVSFRPPALRDCNRYHDEEHANLLNTMWLIAITFLSVGYGDIVPNTYCGRGIAVTTGMMVSPTTILTVGKAIL